MDIFKRSKRTRRSSGPKPGDTSLDGGALEPRSSAAPTNLSRRPIISHLRSQPMAAYLEAERQAFRRFISGD
jgi:hypothetical protein